MFSVTMLSHDSTVTESNHSLVNEILQQFQLDGTQVDTISRNFLQQMSVSHSLIFRHKISDRCS